MSKGAQLTVGATMVFGLLAWFALTNLESGSTFDYYQNLDEFLLTASTSDELSGQALRVHGYVAMESIERDLPAKQVRFRVQNSPPHGAGNSATTLSVLYRGLETPDLFKDGAEVVIEGQLLGSGDQLVFQADNLMAKCPSKFEAKQKALQAEAASL